MIIGLFTGSFNPIHIGHLALANYLREYEGLDEVWFMVSPHNPLKSNSELMDGSLRLHMVKQAIAGYPHFHASDFEFHLPQPSYTIRTLNSLRQAYPEHDFHLVIGSDNWALFPKWRDAKQILAHYPILIYPRLSHPIDEATLPAGVRLSHAPIINVSSTFIRQALGEGRDVRFFLHPSTHALLFSHASSPHALEEEKGGTIPDHTLGLFQ